MSNEPRTTLLLSSRNAEDNQLIWRAAVKRGWTVERIKGIRIPEIDAERIVIYIESLFAQTIARQLGLRLMELENNWLPTIPSVYRQRDVRLTTLADIPESTLPLFLKPPNEKSFPAKVYDSISSLLRDYDPSTPLLAATPVKWESEFRCFCLDGHVRTISPYLRSGDLSSMDGFAATEDELDQAVNFAERLLHDERVDVPRAIVIDVGTIVGCGWAVVEANAAWGSGIYGCDPDEVLDVVKHATVKCDEP